jgi:23S rRNA (guanosine2251-2'-O)-methyltransferase
MPVYNDISDLIEISNSKKEPAFILVLDGIEDPHNFGAIIRTAEAAGIHGIVIRKRRQVQVTDTVMKVSTGAAENVPICQVSNIAEAIRYLKEQAIIVIGIENIGDKLYNHFDFKVPAALVIGSEGKGISRLVKERCDELLMIPMKGKTTSLNASVAAGIAMFEVVRQRGK